MKHLLLFLFVTLFSFCTHAQFRGYEWGTNYAEINKSEYLDGKVVHTELDKIIAKDNIGNDDVFVLYYFNDKEELRAGAYIDNDLSSLHCDRLWKTIKNGISKKYKVKIKEEQNDLGSSFNIKVSDSLYIIGKLELTNDFNTDVMIIYSSKEPDPEDETSKF